MKRKGGEKEAGGNLLKKVFENKIKSSTLKPLSGKCSKKEATYISMNGTELQLTRG